MPSAPLQTVAVLGGSGFVGRMLANRLHAASLQVRILTRARLHARELWSLPNATCVELDVYDLQQLTAALTGCSALVNLVGILNERRDDGRDFARTHVTLTAQALAAAAAAGVPRYLQMSALKAGLEAPSHYFVRAARRSGWSAQRS